MSPVADDLPKALGDLGAPVARQRPHKSIQVARRRAGAAVIRRNCALATATATSKKLRPLGDRVVIAPVAREEVTKSGIVLPDTAKEKPQEGIILAAGPGKILDDGKREQMDVKEGDRVLYSKYAGTEFKVDGEELLIVSQKDILAIVEA
jgi:chaperonin GroES